MITTETFKNCAESLYVVALAPRIDITEGLEEWLRNAAGLTAFAYFEDKEEFE